MNLPFEHLLSRVAEAERIWLFLDYDGTLADFAPTPDHVEPQHEVIELVTQLAAHPRIQVAVVSGRRLDHIEKLLPVPGAILAGTYGIEIRGKFGVRTNQVDWERIRPGLDQLKTNWQVLLGDQEGFYLEDKGWALAIHARFVKDLVAAEIIAAARNVALDMVDVGIYRILGGHKFLEVGPLRADKGRTVVDLLQQYPWINALPIYIGDDDKDEAAFHIIKAQGGIAIVVAKEPRESAADYRLETPQAVHTWLKRLIIHFDPKNPGSYP
jgi:trehalose 6-phosphate phosphatase